MLFESAYFKTDIAEHNLGLLSVSESGLCERRVLELRELAAEVSDAILSLVGDGLSVDEALRALLVYDKEALPHGEDIYKDNLAMVEHYLAAQSSSDRAVFAKILTDALRRASVNLTESVLLPEGGGDGVVVYVKNKLADEAFDVFSEELSDPRVMYAKDFREAARAVSRGEAEYCLLPLEERGGVRISSVSALLYSEDLKINSVTPVFGPDGGAEMKYALISRHFSVPPISPDSDRYLELRISYQNSSELSDLVSAAAFFGASVYRINSSAVSIDGVTENSVTLVLSGNGTDFTSLLVYLTIFIPNFVAVGIYDNIE